MRPNFTCRKIFLLLISFLIFNFAFLIETPATIRYVSKTGLSIPPYTSWETAADSIQKCINISVFGDTIYVANGIYQEQVVMIPGLSLIGAGADSCVINLTVTGIPAVEIKDTCLFSGFKILLPNTLNTWGIKAEQNGYGSKVILNRIVNASLGMSIRYSNPFVYNNIFENNKSIGVRLFNSNSIIRKNYISPITETGGSGIFITAISSDYNPLIDSNHIKVKTGKIIYKSIGASPIIKNNVIEFIQYGSEAIYLSTAVSSQVHNNLIKIGTGQIGIDNYNVNSLQVMNNYIIGKETNSPQGMYVSSQDTVKNNVVSNTVRGIVAGNPQNLVAKYNNLWNNEINYTNLTPDTTNLSVNPMVMNDDPNLGDLDFHLQMYSPLIDAGDPTILDKDGTRSDIGLYGGPYGESYVYVDLPPRSPVNLTASVDSNIVTLKWNKNTEADFSYYKLFYDTTKNFPADSTKLISSQPDTFYYFVIPPETDSLYFKLTAVDNQGNESSPSEEVGVIVTSVKEEWKPVNNYILYQNYPNPFNPSTKIGYKLRERGYVKLYVYDIKGELVSVLVNQVQDAGYYEVEFSSGVSHSGSGESLRLVRSLASGVYIYQIFVSNDNRIPVFSDIKKMVNVK